MIDVTVASWISAVLWALWGLTFAALFVFSAWLVVDGSKERDIGAVLLGIMLMCICAVINIMAATVSLIHLGVVVPMG